MVVVRDRDQYAAALLISIPALSEPCWIFAIRNIGQLIVYTLTESVQIQIYESKIT